MENLAYDNFKQCEKLSAPEAAAGCVVPSQIPQNHLEKGESRLNQKTGITFELEARR